METIKYNDRQLKHGWSNDHTRLPELNHDLITVVQPVERAKPKTMRRSSFWDSMRNYSDLKEIARLQTLMSSTEVKERSVIGS